LANRLLRSGLIPEKGAPAREYRWGERRVIAEGLRLNPWTDIYHSAMTTSWPKFLGALAAVFFALNVLFALLFMIGDAPVANARPGHFLDLFFFSVETISTTGYGDLYPQTLYGHVLAAIENFVSLVATAAMTGVVFARFARPRARLIFAHNPVVFEHDGVATLAVRIVNARNSFISEATAKIWLLSPSVSREGRRYVGFVPLRLQKAENPAFALSWTLFHPIDEASPLFRVSEFDAIEDEINLVVSISGLDEMSSQIVHARQSYVAEDIRWRHEFIDMFRRDENGRSHVDLAKLHDTRPVDQKIKDA
jgi:inward rectifier potassium channel